MHEVNKYLLFFMYVCYIQKLKKKHIQDFKGMLYLHVLSQSYIRTTYQIFVHQFQKNAVSCNIGVN